MAQTISWHFSFGNSTDGPIGFCARVKATSRAEAASKLREAIFQAGTDVTLPGYGYNQANKDGIEYIEVYLNPDAVTEAGVDEAQDGQGNEVDLTDTNSSDDL